jgi:hypothetical protein
MAENESQSHDSPRKMFPQGRYFSDLSRDEQQRLKDASHRYGELANKSFKFALDRWLHHFPPTLKYTIGPELELAYKSFRFGLLLFPPRFIVVIITIFITMPVLNIFLA